MTEAEKLFNETHARLLSAYSIILGFRNSFTEVSDAVENQLQVKAETMFRRLIEDPQWEGLLTSEPGLEGTRIFRGKDQQLAKKSAEALLKQNYGSLDAATLIFFHSLLDAIALDYCRVTALHAPQDWEEDIKNTQVPLLDAKKKSYDQLLRARLESHMEKLERESICFKMDRLLARCQPPPSWSPMYDYVFDRKIIEAFDKQRHAIIHGKALGKPLSIFAVSDSSLHYLLQTGMYLMGLVNFKYKLRFDANYIGQVWQKA